MNRKARDRRIAEEIADELAKALGGPVTLEALAGHDDTICACFERVFDAHGIVNEFAGANVLKCVPRILARRQIDAAVAKIESRLPIDLCRLPHGIALERAGPEGNYSQ